MINTIMLIIIYQFMHFFASYNVELLDSHHLKYIISESRY